MKIAVPTKENIVDDHFGQCDRFTIFTFNEMGTIVNTEIMPVTAGCGCHSDIASILKGKGVRVLLAGDMGDGAFSLLSKVGIRVYRGCTGDVQQLTEDYIQGKIIDAGEGCHHHQLEPNPVCNHKCIG